MSRNSILVFQRNFLGLNPKSRAVDDSVDRQPSRVENILGSYMATGPRPHQTSDT